VTAQEALDAGLIDLIATDQDDLLAQLDGFEVKGPKAGTIDTAGLSVDERDMPFQYDLLQILVNPNVAFLLLLLGVVGIALEFFSPGAIVPGAVGAVSLILGLFGTVQLPVAAIGVVLLVLAVGLIIAEAHLPTGGLLGLAGVGALIAGGLLLFDTGGEGPGISPVVVVAVALAFGGSLVFIGQRALAARKEPFKAGREELVGEVAEVRRRVDPIGQVFIEGALWRARAADPDEPIEAGYRVRVESIDGLTLTVAPLGAGEPEAVAENVGSERGGS
jgi:membrane-bound serine protease (ClpP class)